MFLKKNNKNKPENWMTIEKLNNEVINLNKLLVKQK